jgi:SRSO17 transposase
MNRTWTPEWDPEVWERLEAYAARVRSGFNHARQALWCGVYLRGLLMEGERKSIEPLSARVSLPAALGAVADPEQALQQFVGQSSSRRGGRRPGLPGGDGRSLGRARRGLSDR